MSGKPGWRVVLCPNTREHKGSTRCNAKLKLFKEPAVFEEVFFCPKCGSHWRITLNAMGAMRAILLPDDLLVSAKPFPMHVVGEKIKKRLKQNA
jgi:uncharacterized protein YbaR (Trm112 family)